VVAAVNAVSRAISPSRIGPRRCISNTRISPWVGVKPAPSAHSHAWLRIAVLNRSKPWVTRPVACSPYTPSLIVVRFVFLDAYLMVRQRLETGKRQTPPVLPKPLQA
jgi:hypothetical protein